MYEQYVHFPRGMRNNQEMSIKITVLMASILIQVLLYMKQDCYTSIATVGRRRLKCTLMKALLLKVKMMYKEGCCSSNVLDINLEGVVKSVYKVFRFVLYCFNYWLITCLEGT
jgi:hypothetical protein